VQKNEKSNPSQPADDTLLKETAVAIGGVAGKVAALAKSILPHHEEPAKAPAQKRSKLKPKNKSRLPRKEKKALAKKAVTAKSNKKNAKKRPVRAR
jgi:hypothetical protein